MMKRWLLLSLVAAAVGQEYADYEVQHGEEEARAAEYHAAQMQKALRLNPVAASTRPGHCGPCEKDQCASPSNCVAGVVPDRCGCCLVCARSEGQLCDERPEDSKFGGCGDGLHCVRRKNTGEAVCQCQVEKMVCGNDGTSYPTICALTEEATARGKPADPDNTETDGLGLPLLAMKYWGPCKEAPVIISPPSDSYGPLGANLTLDCEARGHPAPEISWKFVSAKGETVSLPSDDQSVSIQMRGGPEPLMVTGWAQILSLDPNYIGIYHCIATNTEGQVYSMASVGVYKNSVEL